MNLVILAILRALLWPLFVWGDLGFYLRHALFRKPNMGTAKDQLKFGQLFGITLVCMAAAAAVAIWLRVRGLFQLGENELGVIATITYLAMLVYSLPLWKPRHFAFNEQRWQFSYPAAFFSGLVMMVGFQMQPQLISYYGVLAVVFALIGAFGFKHRPKNMAHVMRKSM